MKLKTFFIAAILLAITSTISAQNYKTGIGGRVGVFNGITVKHFHGRRFCFQGMNFQSTAVDSIFKI